MEPSRSNLLAATTSAKTPLARNIRAARKAANLTQSELAALVGVSDLMVISKWERGIYRPSEENLLTLAEKLKRDLAWFYTDHSRTEREAA